MRLRILPLLIAAIAVSAVAAGAPPTTHYRWTDTAGVVHFSDTIPAGAVAGGYVIVNDEGRVVREVGRELTPAERRQAVAAKTRQAAHLRARQQQNISDLQLLSAYPNEQDLIATQSAQVRQIQADIATVTDNLHSQEDSLTDLLAHAADLEHAHAPISRALVKRIADQRETVTTERDALARRRTDLHRAQTRATAQLQRYRTLRARFGDAGDAPATRPSGGRP